MPSSILAGCGPDIQVFRVKNRISHIFPCPGGSPPQSLFYFVPQEKGLTWRRDPLWTWKYVGDSIFHPENGNIWSKTGQNRWWHMLRSSLVFSDFNFMHYWGQTPCKGLGAQTCKYVRANHSTAYFSSLKSALMCPLIWLADPKPPPISSRTYKCQAS